MHRSLASRGRPWSCSRTTSRATTSETRCRRDASDDDAPATPGGLKTWSDLGGLADKDFAAFTSAEIAEAAAVLSRLVWSPGERRTRRWVRGHGSRVDLRRVDRRQPAHRRRHGGAQTADAARAPPRAGAAVRRQRIDGALLPHASALRPRRDEAPPPRRGVSLRHAADANHQATPRVAGRRRARRRVASRCRTGRAGRELAEP